VLQATSYHQARRPEEGGKLLATWLVLMVPAGLIAVAIGEALVPELLAAQGDSVRNLAHLFILTAALVPIADLFMGMLLGDHDFLFCNAIRLVQPATVAVIFLVLWATGVLSVESALWTTFGIGLATLLVTAWRVLRRHPLRRPSWLLARSTIWYGLRAHRTNLTSMANARLDLLLIPAFLAASSVGLYSVATSVSWIVVMVAGALAPLVLPAAARFAAQGSKTVIDALHATVGVASVLAVAIALLAGVGVRLVYGADFEGSVLPLRLLLPGCVLLAAAGVLSSGLNALGRPLTAALTNVGGMIVTVVGLSIFLRSGGINAAAVVSTVSYAVIFVSALILYRRASGIGWLEFRPSRTQLALPWRSRGRSLDPDA
jgi:O-antigen/teichoic acid export membrane protein